MRIRPKSDYLNTASWDSLYVLTEHWQKDVDFYKDELRFMSGLISKYFIWMTKDENISKVQKIVVSLKTIENQLKEMDDKLKKHLKSIGLLMENAFSHDEQEFRDEHVQLEEDLVEFMNDYKKLKRDVFTITEHVMESEKLQHLLTVG